MIALEFRANVFIDIANSIFVYMARTSLSVDKQKEMYDLHQQGLKPKDIAAITQVSLPTAYSYTRRFSGFKSFDEYMQDKVRPSYKPIVVRSERDLLNPASLFMVELMIQMGYVPTNSQGEIVLNVKKILQKLKEHPKRQKILSDAGHYLNVLLDEDMMHDMI